MNDLVRRQAVLGYIDRVLTIGTGKKKSLDFVRKYVETMPSAQPIVFCKDCAYGEKLPNTIRCEYNDYLPFDYYDFCSHGVQRVNGGKDE